MKLAFFLFSHSRLTSKESGNSFRSIFKIFLELFTFHPCSAIVLIWIIISSCLICCNNILPGLISFTLDLYREFQTQKVERSRIICQIMSVPSLHACNGSPFFFFFYKGQFFTVASETYIIWQPSSSLNSPLILLTLFQSHWLPYSSWLRQEAFYWLFLPPDLLFSQIRLTSSYLLWSLFKYPLANDAYPENPLNHCPLLPLYIHLLSFPFLIALFTL